MTEATRPRCGRGRSSRGATGERVVDRTPHIRWNAQGSLRRNKWKMMMMTRGKVLRMASAACRGTHRSPRPYKPRQRGDGAWLAPGGSSWSCAIRAARFEVASAAASIGSSSSKSLDPSGSCSAGASLRGGGTQRSGRGYLSGNATPEVPRQLEAKMMMRMIIMMMMMVMMMMMIIFFF